MRKFRGILDKEKSHRKKKNKLIRKRSEIDLPLTVGLWSKSQVAPDNTLDLLCV